MATHPRPVSLARTSLRTPPTLPPKGKTLVEPESDEESEYKVPSSTISCAEDFYQVPASIPIPVQLSVNGYQPLSSDKKIPSKEPVEITDGKVSDAVNNNDEIDGGQLSSVLDANDKSEYNVQKNGNPEEVNTLSSVSESKTDEKIFTKKLSSNSVKDLIAKLNQNDQMTETSHPPIGINSSFKKSKLSISSSFEKNALLVENNLNKFGISKSVTEIKNDIESKEKQVLDSKEITPCDIKFKDDRFETTVKSDVSSINTNKGIYENLESERDDVKPTQEVPGK